jgi:hypothetical protein
MFFFVKKKIVVDCFVGYESIANLYGFKRAVKVAPEWWKSLPSRVEQFSLQGLRPAGTMKHCSGFVDLFRNAWVLHMWQDFRISINREDVNHISGSNGVVKPLAGMPDIHINPPIVSNSAFENYHSIKINSPWFLREKKGVKFSWIPAIWDSIKRYDDLHVPPAVIEFKKNSASNVNIFVPKKIKTYDFAAGQPLVYLIPISENKVEFRNHAVDVQEINRMVTNHPFETFKFVKSEFKE